MHPTIAAAMTPPISPACPPLLELDDDCDEANGEHVVVGMGAAVGAAVGTAVGAVGATDTGVGAAVGPQLPTVQLHRETGLTNADEPHTAFWKVSAAIVRLAGMSIVRAGNWRKAMGPSCGLDLPNST